MSKPIIFEVGGCVRDKLLGIEPKDFDYVVVAASDSYMKKAGFQRVGTDFPVYIHPESGSEYALARKEVSTGDSHREFSFSTDKSVTLEDDLYRRDLTINAIAYDPETGIYRDPYNGMTDIKNRVIRHVSKHFSEDPLRVLRVARFAARYHHLGFTVHPDTLALMQSIASKGMLRTLTPERVYKELSRALTERSPDVFFTTLDDAECLAPLFPEIEALKGQTQPEKHHPEVDTFIHQMLVLQQAAKMTNKVSVMMAALCHDFGKGLTPKDELPHHHCHERLGVRLVEDFCERIKAPKDIAKLAMLTSEYHTHIHRASEITAPRFMELLNKFDVFRGGESMFLDFLVACEADARGRTGFEDRPYPQSEVAQKILLAAKEAVWSQSKLMQLEPEKRSYFIQRERTSRIKHALGFIRSSKSYLQYRDKYTRFRELTAYQKLALLLKDKGNYHSCYIHQTLCREALPDDIKSEILSLALKLQCVESEFDSTNFKDLEKAYHAKQKLFVSAINE